MERTTPSEGDKRTIIVLPPKKKVIARRADCGCMTELEMAPLQRCEKGIMRITFARDLPFQPECRNHPHPRGTTHVTVYPVPAAS